MNAPLIIDSFAGGGGASTGIEMALGRSPDIAINHNAAALALHKANHPETLHLSENVYKIDPLDHLRRKHIGLAWFSPDCKHFSKAKGGKPVERNIRDLAWIIPGWIERIQKSGGKVDVVILENVEEFRKYGPLMETERGLMPDPDREGETFKKWCAAIRKLGGKLQFRELRACDYGAPTIRKRLFIIIRFDGKPIVWPVATHAAPNSPDVNAGRKLPWRTAAEIIDWSLPCPSIFETSPEIMLKHKLRAIRPLADATMARVARGMKRYVLDAERPFIVNLTHGARLEDIDQPANTITGANRGEKAVVSPYVASYYGHNGGRAERTSETHEPLATIVTENRHAVVAPHLMTMRNSGKPFNGPGEPTHTITAGGAGLTLVAPVLTAAQQGGSNRDVREPHHTITASRKDQNSVIVPSLMSMKGTERRDSDVDAPHPTVLAGGGHSALVTAFMAQHNNDSRREGGVNPGRKVDEPVSTVTQTGSQQGLISAFVSRQFGEGIGRGIDEPAPTATANVNKSALVSPFFHAYYGSDQDTPTDEPLHTLTTKPRFSHVEGQISAPPFTVEQSARARQVADFMRAQGFWDQREFVTVIIAGQTFVIVDIGMRMLTPRELYSAQGFPANYEIERDGEGNVFSKSVQISCVGNSVSPPVAAALVAANCSDLMVFREAAE